MCIRDRFHNVVQSIIVTIKALACEKQLSIFLINDCGNIIGLSDDNGTSFRGIPARSFFVSDLKLGMHEEPDKNMIKWSFLPNWSDKLHIVTPTDFDALLELS